MIVKSDSDHFLSFISSQLQGGGQAGCGAAVIAEKLARYLQENSSDGKPWKVFDSNLIHQVLEDHNLPARLARFLPEDRVSQLDDIVADIFDVRPPVQTMIQQMSETVLKLAFLGNVILIGRGSNVITAKVPHVLHVRLVAPLEQRIEHALRLYPEFNKNEVQARKFCVSQDRARARYVKKYFNADVNDPLLYHLTINTGQVGYDETARIIGEAVLRLDAKMT